MIRQTLTAAAASVALGACATAESIPVRGETPGGTCSDGRLGQFVGRQATSELGAEMRRLSGAAIFRWVPHGTLITMEYRSDRLTVFLDAQGRIERISCS